MSLSQTVYPPQSFPFQLNYPYNVTGVAISVLAIKIKNPTITSVVSMAIDAATTVATITSLFTVTVV